MMNEELTSKKYWSKYWKAKPKIENIVGKDFLFHDIINKYVPKKLTDRPKMGFAIPIDIWLRKPLREWAESLLNETRLRQEGYFNVNLIRNKWKEHLSGKKNWQNHLWDVLMFQSWNDSK